MTLQRTILASFAALLLATTAAAQQKQIKIGFIYDLTGPFAGGGSEPAQLGTKAMVDLINERGGVEGYRIVPVFVDAQSKVDVAINEMTRLLDQEKVDIVAGVYSSAQCVPMVQQIDARKKFLWLNVCIATAVFKDKKLSYVFRPQAHSDQFGAYSCDYINHYSKERLGAVPKNLKVAIIYEDGPYGAGVAAGNEAQCKKHGMQIVLKEGYSATAPDLSSLVTKLKRARADVLLHTGYNPDITLFLRQSKEQGLKFKAIIGHGAGHSQIDKLKEAFGKDIEAFHTVDPIASQLLDAKKLKPGVGELTQEMVKRYRAQFEKDIQPLAIAPHVSMGFNNMWVLLNDVLPRAIQKHGGFSAEALAKAARETDIPEGGTMQGYGVKFQPAGHAMAGQNMRAIAAVFQVVDGEFKHVHPPVVASMAAPPVLLPSSSPYLAR
jgi:branched-chain amino acid transport system substrate-binding protein